MYLSLNFAYSASLNIKNMRYRHLSSLVICSLIIYCRASSKFEVADSQHFSLRQVIKMIYMAFGKKKKKVMIPGWDAYDIGQVTNLTQSKYQNLTF